MKKHHYVVLVIIVLALFYCAINDNSIAKGTVAELRDNLEQILLNTKQKHYESVHSVAASWGGKAKDVEITDFKADPNLNA